MAQQTTIKLPTGDKIRSASARRYVLIYKANADAKPAVIYRSDELPRVQARAAQDFRNEDHWIADNRSGEVLFSGGPAARKAESAARAASEGDGVVAALTPAPEPTPVPAAPETEKSDPEPTKGPVPAQTREGQRRIKAARAAEAAPAEELTKIRVGKGFLAYLEAERPNSDSLLEKARTAHRYKDGCSVLDLTPGEASALLESAQEAVADAKRTGWTRSAETGAKAILRWMDAAGITA